MKQILFVGDEPRILEGLKRSLRSQRDHWAMASEVHVANALAQGCLRADGKQMSIPDGVDAAYLESLCVLDRLPAWREMAAAQAALAALLK